MSKPNLKPQFYSLPLKRASNMITDADRSMRLFAQNVKTYVTKYEIEDWGSSPISDFMDAYLSAKVLRDYISGCISSPDEAIKEYLQKNKIDGVLVTRDQLSLMYTLSTNLEQSKEYINKTYGISTVLN